MSNDLHPTYSIFVSMSEQYNQLLLGSKADYMLFIMEELPAPVIDNVL